MPKANASEVQYLAYYAASRPKKLIKVGSYISQRTKKSVGKGRSLGVIVSLDILKILIEKCHANMSLFGLDVLITIRVALDSRDPSVMQNVLYCVCKALAFSIVDVLRRLVLRVQ